MADQESNSQDRAPEQPSSAPEHVIYVGPSLPGGALAKYSVFLEGAPLHLEDRFAQIPALKALFVPVEQLSKAQADLANPSSALAQVYAAAESALKPAPALRTKKR